MQCEVCGNDYHKTFQVIIDDQARVFDSFECAIHALAPRCEHCGCTVVGHGVETDDRIFCCSHCAARAGQRPAQRRSTDPVERTSEDSFPASDPPAWNAGDRRSDMKRSNESGRVGYLVLYLLGAPVGLLLVLWVLFGNNLLSPG